MRIIELVRTCYACPSQWEGKLEDGRPVYIRVRWGYCSVRVGKVNGNIWSAVDGEEVLGFGWGNSGYDGLMSDEELVTELSLKGWIVDVTEIKFDDHLFTEQGLEKAKDELDELYEN